MSHSKREHLYLSPFTSRGQYRANLFLIAFHSLHLRSERGGGCSPQVLFVQHLWDTEHASGISQKSKNIQKDSNTGNYVVIRVQISSGRLQITAKSQTSRASGRGKENKLKKRSLLLLFVWVKLKGSIQLQLRPWLHRLKEATRDPKN